MKNRYVNKDEENSDDDAASDAKRDAPPPTDAEFRQKMLPAMSSAGLAPVQNRGIFHRAKTRGMHIYILSSVYTYYVVSVEQLKLFLVLIQFQVLLLIIQTNRPIQVQG